MTRLEENIIPSENEKLGDEIDDLTSRVKDLERKYNSKDCNDANETIRIIIRNLPERINEDLHERISNLIQHGLRLSDIDIVSAERKISNSQHKPGVIIVTLKEEGDRKKIMANKSTLKNSERYERVFIEFDLPPYQRALKSNLHTIAQTLGRGKLQVRGSRLYEVEENRPHTPEDNTYYRNSRDEDNTAVGNQNNWERNSHRRYDDQRYRTDERIYQEERSFSRDRSRNHEQYRSSSKQEYSDRSNHFTHNAYKRNHYDSDRPRNTRWHDSENSRNYR